MLFNGIPRKQALLRSGIYLYEIEINQGRIFCIYICLFCLVLKCGYYECNIKLNQNIFHILKLYLYGSTGFKQVAMVDLSS